MEKWNISSPKYESDILNDALNVSPWRGHRNFIYDYIKYIKPKTIVELGTHYGCSFFAMCQSVKDNQLNSKIYAIDTWEGDPQAGFYGNEVWDIVNTTKQLYFNKQDTVFMRMLFNDAVQQFGDEAFDLIHIDGLHTYEAVMEDFRNWLPKLRKDGVMLFHDVNSEKKYGTNVFWEEIKQKYQYYFEFTHSWGLGILFPKGDHIYNQLMENNFEDKLIIYQYKALYEYESLKTKDLTQMADERFEAIKKQNKMIEEKDEGMRNQGRMIDERDATIESQRALIEEKDEGIRNQGKMIDERDATIESQRALIEEKDEGIRNQGRMIDERDATIESQRALIEEKDEEIRNQGKMIDERDATIESQRALIEEKDEGIRNQGRMIDERDATIESQRALIEEKDEGIRNQGRMIDERDATIESQRALIEEKDEGICNQGRMIDERDATIEEQRTLCLEKDKIISEQLVEIQHLNELIQKVNKHKVISKLIFH